MNDQQQLEAYFQACDRANLIAQLGSLAFFLLVALLAWILFKRYVLDAK